MGDEIDAGLRRRVACHAAGVDVLLLPQRHQRFAKGVGTKPREVSGAGARAGCGDGGVAGVAAEALQILRLPRCRLVELDHGFAQAGHVKHFQWLSRGTAEPRVPTRKSRSAP